MGTIRSSCPTPAIMEKQQQRSWQSVLSLFQFFKEDIRVTDIYASAIIVFNLINSIVDQIVFCDNEIDDERILQAGIDAVFRFLTE
ncbi:hypothetical protein GH808_05750 [Acetobacterium fimetarium]|uniref:Uncharacterized protein n=1 Tax=Acetobacterium fimetarium TaxID=52691 RepID=A0ABR6WTR0_9FIRM|nr:hypothetical protein [Acetobacterium fimetarium]MBC3803940.1 hypothetical protein [Acetobacterium fimetarium]